MTSRDHVDLSPGTTVARLASWYERATSLAESERLLIRDEEAVRGRVAAPLVRLLDEVIDFLDVLDRRYASSDEPAGEIDWDSAFDLTPVPGELRPERHPVERGMSAAIADTCFTSMFELKRARRTLAAPDIDHTNRLDACDRAVRKLRRSTAAVADAVAHAADLDSPLDEELDTELHASRAVRRMYSKFRRSLTPWSAGDDDSVRRAIRYAGVSLAQMVGSANFADVRMADRQLLLLLQRRVIDWVREGDRSTGVLLLKDIETAAALLRAINRRQELVEHDASALVAARAAVESERGGEELRAALAPLYGRDDTIDDAVDMLSRPDAIPPAFSALRTVLDRLAADLDAGPH